MQLISLSANKDSFKTVHFKNETGINLIVSSQKHPKKSDKGDTTNGVGKSLLIAIIHFCLGSSSKKEFQKQLNGWVFTLKFKVKEKEYISKRSTDNQNTLLLNNQKYSKTEFNQKLELLLFSDIPENVSEISFRSLLAFFIRPRKSSYVKELNPNNVSKPFQIQMINAYLLGLDVLLAEEKHKLKQEKDRIKKLVDNLKDDNYLRDFFIGKKDLSLTKQELKETIENLETNLKEFQIAEDYYEIKEEADKLKQNIEKIQNDVTLFQIQVNNIDESRKISPDIKKENIEKIYSEASVIISSGAIKQLAELEKFYEHISKNREKRLLEQKNELLKKIEIYSSDKQEKSSELNNKMQYLNAHHALDVYTKLSNKLSDLKSKNENLVQYEELFENYKQENRKIKDFQIKASEKTATYLKDAQSIISETNDFFRALVKRFYPKSAAGITVYNNESDNQIRYDINAKIEADKSDGIGNVKIFTYDLTLLLKGFGHKIDFIFHDSRILDGIDPRQKHELFLIINEYIKQSNKQYILTVNYNQIEEIMQYFSDSEYKNIITDNIILELKDSSPSDKLLGIQIDIDYD